MRLIRQLICLAVCTPIFSVWADQAENLHYDEEITVQSVPFDNPTAETALPVSVLSGERLDKVTTSTLGDTLKGQLGVHNSSFGPGVGLPVIRGQSGTRVQVLQNNVNTGDVSTLSPDHNNGIEPILAERIEVIRGPSTLLYGNGAIGGVVNVIDGRIPESSFEETQFVLEQSHTTNDEENKTVFKLNHSFGNFNVHLDGFTRDNDNVEIDGFAIDEAAVEAREELFGHEEGHDEEEDHDEEEEGHHEEELVNSNGFIDNSEAEAEGGTFGFSFSNDAGFIGFSASFLENEYGLPPGSHGHHDEEGHDEEEEGHDEEEEGQEFVRLDVDQTRYDFRAGLNFEQGFVRQLRADISYTDYEHDELEIEASGEVMPGTKFENSGIESRFILSHAPIGGFTGVIGLQYTDTEFEAAGEEAFIPKTDESGLALFVVERLEYEKSTWEFGARLERTELEPSSCDESETSASFSVSGIFDINEESNVIVGVSRSERSPTTEERYSNIDLASCGALDEDDQVLHASTGLFEVGDPGLDTETSVNLEVGYRKFAGPWTVEANAYYNEISDYIYLELVEEEHANYVAEDASFYGVEGKLSIPLFERNGDSTVLTFQGDYVRAEFDDTGDVPRIPPARVGVHLAHFADRWTFDIGVTHAFEQDDTGEFETETDSYTDLEIYADYHWPLGDSAELKLFARGTNLLDEEIRNHSSFLKNFSPEAGRGVRVGLRLTY